jgi:SAM-dependent methyltransferase
MEEAPLTATASPQAYGEAGDLTWVDRFGVWLSSRKIRRAVSFKGARIGDFGCGFDASFTRSVLGEVAHATLVDVALAPDLAADPRVTAISGFLPAAVAAVESDSLDVVLCVSVIEHLDDPDGLLAEIHRVLRPGGTCFLNVPSWRGKWFLELSAFRLSLSPAESIDDHKTYYDPRDLWPKLVAAGFLPSAIRCRRHKMGLNTYAVCRRAPLPAPEPA